MFDSFKGVIQAVPSALDQVFRSSVDAAQAHAQTANMREKKHSNQVEALTAELEVACHALAQARHAFGERRAEGEAAEKEADAMDLATKEVRRLEVAVAHAKDTLKAAQANTKRLKQEVVNAQRYETRMHFKTVVGPKVEQFILDAKRLVEEDIIAGECRGRGRNPSRD